MLTTVKLKYKYWYHFSTCSDILIVHMKLALYSMDITIIIVIDIISY